MLLSLAGEARSAAVDYPSAVAGSPFAAAGTAAGYPSDAADSPP